MLTHRQRKAVCRKCFYQTTPVKSLADCPVISVQSVRNRTNMAFFIIKGELSIIRLGRNGAVGGKGYKQSFGILLFRFISFKRLRYSLSTLASASLAQLNELNMGYDDLPYLLDQTPRLLFIPSCNFMRLLFKSGY